MSAERFYSLLVRAYPERFRVRFEDGMRDAFRRDHAAARDGGLLVLGRFWALTTLQALWYGLAERRARRVMGVFADSPTGSRTSRASWFTVDWRDAWRSLMTTPTVTSVAVLSLALGIGANLALFTIANSLLLKPLPVRDPDRLVLLNDTSWTNPIWEQIRDRQDSCSMARSPGRTRHSTSRPAASRTLSRARMPAADCSTCSACPRSSDVRSPSAMTHVAAGLTAQSPSSATPSGGSA